jgi:hypothetical protein
MPLTFTASMKKFTVTILATLYLLVTCGVSVNFHYCMGKLRSVDLGYNLDDRCGKCGMSTKDSGCCHDDTQWFKVNDNHQATHADVTVTAPVVDIAHPEPFQSFTPLFYSVINNYGNHSPPLLFSPQDLNTLHCVFRI